MGVHESWGQPCAVNGGLTTITLDGGARISVASGIATLAKLLLNWAEEQGYHIRREDTGAYNCRKIRGSERWSVHSWGLAIDVNWNTNPMGAPLRTDMPAWFYETMEKYGFTWGGRWTKRPDAMHFEFHASTEAARLYTAAAVSDLTSAPPPHQWPPFNPENKEYGLYPHDTGKRTLKVTSPRQNGGDIEYLQWVMKHQGLVLDPDGWFGPKTAEQVKHVQRWNDLVEDGICGPKTWAMIDTYAKRS